MARKTICYRILLLILSVFFILSCSRSESPDGTQLAKVNNTILTLEEFAQEMEQLPKYVKTLVLTPEGKKEFLQKLIDRELLLQEGEKRGLEKDEKILVGVEQYRKQLIVEAVLEDLYRGQDEVHQDEVERYYQENKEKFSVGERVHVRHIVVKTLRDAEEIKRQLDDGEDFIALAKQYSISPTGKKGGDLGYIERGHTGDAFGKAAFSLKAPGEVSDIVKTSFGYHIIRLEGKKAPYQRTLGEVYDEIVFFLRQRKREKILAAYLTELKEKSDIVVNGALLDEEEPSK